MWRLEPRSVRPPPPQGQGMGWMVQTLDEEARHSTTTDDGAANKDK